MGNGASGQLKTQLETEQARSSDSGTMAQHQKHRKGLGGCVLTQVAYLLIQGQACRCQSARCALSRGDTVHVVKQLLISGGISPKIRLHGGSTNGNVARGQE